MGSFVLAAALGSTGFAGGLCTFPAAFVAAPPLALVTSSGALAVSLRGILADGVARGGMGRESQPCVVDLESNLLAILLTTLRVLLSEPSIEGLERSSSSWPPRQPWCPPPS